MNKVVTLNIGGNAYQLEEGAYDALRRYLDQAGESLAENPDKAEILSDLEAAIAQRCTALLGATKTVLTAPEIEQILKDMGPVKTDEDHAEHAEGANKTPHAPKRLYRLSQGKIVGGVCTGLAAYFNIDVSLVRLIWVLLTIFTSGAFVLAYFILMMVIPEADTPAEQAAAYGTRPLTAQDLVDHAKDGYDRFKNSKEWHTWKHHLREQSRAWRREQKRNWNYAQRNEWPRSPGWELAHSVMGFIWFIFILFCAWWLYHHVAPVHEFFDLIPVWLTIAGNWVYHLFAH